MKEIFDKLDFNKLKEKIIRPALVKVAKNKKK